MGLPPPGGSSFAGWGGVRGSIRAWGPGRYFIRCAASEPAEEICFCSSPGFRRLLAWGRGGETVCLPFFNPMVADRLVNPSSFSGVELWAVTRKGAKMLEGILKEE